jgi:uncharacterized membrane protein YfcA
MRQFLAFEVFIPFTVGAILASFLGVHIVVTLDENILKLILGVFILYLVWGPKLKKMVFLSPYMQFSMAGFLSTLASLFVGASGPLVAALISRASQTKEIFIATHAISMVVQHGLKTMVFGIVGFVFYDYALLILLMIFTGFLGTYVGKHLVLKLSEKTFSIAYKVVITLLAIRLLWKALTDLF